MVKFGRKFFFDTKHSKKRRIVTYIIAGVVVLFLIIILALIIRGIKGKKKPVKPKETKVVVRTELDTELYDLLPEKTSYFEKLENFDVDKITVTYPDYLPKEEAYDECTEDQIKVLEAIKNGKDASSYENPYDCVRYKPTGIGSYDVTVNFNDKDYTVTLNVIDTKAPVLVAKAVEITEGETFAITDFVESCSDNSKKDCTYEYYYRDYNSNSDFSKLTEVGNYEISIVALDGSGNTSVPADTTLTIKEKPPIKVYTVKFNSDGGSEVASQQVNENEKATAPNSPTRSGYKFDGWYTGGKKYDFNTPVTSDISLIAKWTKQQSGNNNGGPKTSTCSNGDLKYNSSKYPTVALFVADGKCAISKNDLTYLTKGSKLNVIMSTEVNKLREWQKQKGVEYCISVIDGKPQGVPNTSNKGYVGYTIGFSIAEAEIVNGQCTSPAKEVARYYLNDKGKRVFSLNIINMPES